MSLMFICGYRGFGKDTLFKTLPEVLNGELPIDGIARTVWRRPDFTEKIDGVLHYSFHRIAFADKLKDFVSKMLDCDRSLFDNNKSDLIPNSLDNNILLTFGRLPTDKLTYRDLMIDTAKYYCSIYQLYWVKMAVDDYQEDCINVITDWRFYHELEFANLTKCPKYYTIRVDRDDIVPPPINIASEHELDDYRTDLLVLNKGMLPHGIFSDYIPY